MTERPRLQSVCKLSAKRMARVWHSVWLAVLAVVAMPYTSAAGVVAAERLEMIRACEAVIIDQSFAALSEYDPAPFSSGAPGEKSYAVFNRPRNIVSIAKLAHGKWVECTVREAERDILSLTERRADWPKEFAVAFPASEYLHATWRVTNRFGPVAIRCDGKSLLLMVYPGFGQNSEFAVTLTNEPSLGYPKNPCLQGGA